MKITMDKKWAQRKDPTKEVRVLCVDSGHSKSPVVYVDSSGFIFATAPEGYYLGRDREHLHDLVPLQEKTEDVWMIVRNNGSFVHNAFKDKEACKEWVYLYGTASYQPYKIVRMTEVEGESYER